MKTLQSLTASAALALLTCLTAQAEDTHHYVFFNRERARISEASFLGTKALEGAQIKYTWRELEPEQDAYDFTPIRADLRILSSRGKRLFIQLQDVSFDNSIVNVPGYLLTQERYHGGADKQYDIKDDDEERAVAGGWVARRWDPAVQERFHKLLAALSKEFDGRIEGITLPETAITFGESGRLFPKGFSNPRYRDAVIENMTALKHAFPKSVAMQYANFMPGEWLPDTDRGYLRSVYARAKQLGVAVGGPDLLPHKRGQMNHAYRMMREFAGALTTGIAVQDGNYEAIDPSTKRQASINELLSFARDYLKVKYIFWCTEEPYYSKRLLPRLNAAQPAASGSRSKKGTS